MGILTELGNVFAEVAFMDFIKASVNMCILLLTFAIPIISIVMVGSVFLGIAKTSWQRNIIITVSGLLLFLYVALMCVIATPLFDILFWH